MGLDQGLLHDARQARDRSIAMQRDAERAQVAYQHLIRRLHADGGTLREIADALGLSYQRVHQIVDVSSGKGAVKSSNTRGCCAFCGVERSQVRSVIAGPGLLICDRCVDLAMEVVAEHRERANDWTLLTPVAAGRRRERCSFCGRRRDQVDAMADAPQRPAVGMYARRAPGVRVCRECLALCGEILSETGDPDVVREP